MFLIETVVRSLPAALGFRTQLLPWVWRLLVPRTVTAIVMPLAIFCIEGVRNRVREI